MTGDDEQLTLGVGPTVRFPLSEVFQFADDYYLSQVYGTV